MKIDTDKLKTPANYAKSQKISRQAVYKKIAENKVKSVTIDGIPFVKI
jgi:hypothetical protein